jgi:hypothetical protein
MQLCPNGASSAAPIYRIAGIPIEYQKKDVKMSRETYLGSSNVHGVQAGDRGVRPGEHEEGTIAKMIEEQTSKLPSDIFLWAAGGSIAGSLIFHLSGDHKNATFVGQWAPTFLILGLYNKLVKVAGSD